MRRLGWIGLVLVLSVPVLAQDTASVPPVPTVASLQAEVLSLREQLVQAKSEALRATLQAETFEARWRGCEVASEQDRQARHKAEIDALQAEQKQVEADKGKAGTVKQ